LLNCSPDVAVQIEGFPPLHPSQPRGTPLTGMLFTDANVDHLGGLAVLRQGGAGGFVVRSSGVVRAIAIAQPAFASFASPPHRWLEAPLDAQCKAEGDEDIVGNRLSVRALAVSGTTPGYDGRRSVCGAVVAYEIAERGRAGALLFAPVFSAIDGALARAVTSASVAFLDGSFYSD
jgi:pyrroloquinoline quinone biosynthesis protein B